MSSSLQQIAERLNISTASVSRALNGKAGVSTKIRKQVLEAAEELNILTSPAAHNMVSTKSLAVAFVIRRLLVSMVDDNFYNNVMKGAEQELSQYGYHLVYIPIEVDNADTIQLPASLDKKRLDGLIVVGPELSTRVINRLRELDIPIVLCANRDPYVEIDSVTSANKEGAKMAVQHLIDHGHQKISCISGPKEWSSVGDRVDGYMEAMQEHGFDISIYCCSGYLTVDAGYDLTRRLIEDQPLVTAVFAANDPMAIGAINAIKDLGKKVPSDLAVVGFDNIFFTENVNPPLTTVYIHKEQIGMLAARRLLEIIQTGPQIPVDTRVKNELVIRQSCGCSANISQSSYKFDRAPVTGSKF